MSDPTLLLEKLEQIEDALNKIKRRFSGINSPDDLMDTPDGIDKLDAISMMLIAIGESFKKIDKDTNGTLLQAYSEIDWKGVKGIRDVLSHNYFNIDAEEIFFICQNNIEPLYKAVITMQTQLKKQTKIPPTTKTE